ncbi:MAG: hypothetical protein ACJAZ8_000464 [Planctomycetota bacterium]|jgi:hypothetical protein
MIAIPSPGLRRLMRLECRGYFRGILRRLKTPKGATFALLGALLLAVWMRSLFRSPDVLGSGDRSATLDALGGIPESDLILRTICLGVLVLVFISGIVTRGIHIPPDRLERLLALPVSRRDFLRYRLWSVVARTMTGAPILAVLAMVRTGNSMGTLLAVPLFLGLSSVLGFLASLLSAGMESNPAFVRVTDKLRSGGRFLLLMLLLLIPVVTVGRQAPEMLPSWIPSFGAALSDSFGQVDFPALVRLLTRPLDPFIGLAQGSGLTSLLGNGSLCVLILLSVLELAARVPVDFREMAIEGAKSSALRIRNVGSVGRAASSGRARVGLFGVPHMFGRGPMGTVAWRKLSGIWRKARGFLVISLFLGCFLLFGVRLIFGGDLFGGELSGQSAEDLTDLNDMGSAVLALLGTLYLTNGLRFDFREDLAQLDILKSWPLQPWKMFLGSLLPQTLAISLVVSALLLIWLIISEATGLFIFLLALGLPAVVFAWVAVDNIAFLIWPVRFVPGQAGQLQHIGRGLLLTFARMTLFLVSFGLAACFGALAWLALIQIDNLSPELLFTLVALSALGVLVAVDFGLAVVGGLAFARYDPARDRV